MPTPAVWHDPKRPSGAFLVLVETIMARRKSPLLTAFSRLARSSMRQGARISRAAGRRSVAAGEKFADSARHVLSGVITPAGAPGPLTGGSWSEGRWGLGPMAMRHYRLFIPAGATARKPIPLLLLLHGCAQDSAAFAASTRCASLARDKGFAVLMPEQAREANPQRCWNWFGNPMQIGLEAKILMAIVDHVQAAHPRLRGPLFALGLSAGGAMALTLGLQFSARFAAVGSHSGAAPFSAASALQAGQSMRGRRSPDAEAIVRHLEGRAPPPLLLIHGDSDRVVDVGNARAAAALWLDLQPEGRVIAERSSSAQRGGRHAVRRTDWLAGGQPCVRLLEVAGLGHAWSGGAAGQAFSDPAGPDALRLAWQFFSLLRERGGAGRV